MQRPYVFQMCYCIGYDADRRDFLYAKNVCVFFEEPVITVDLINKCLSVDVLRPLIK